MSKVFENVTSIDELVQRVRDELHCMAVFVHRLTEEDQTIVAMAWPDAPPNLPRSVPVCHSICQHTADSGAVLAIDDAFTHPLTMRHKITEVHGIAAYLGATVNVQGDIRSTICAVERRRRAWNEQDRLALARAVAVMQTRNL